MDMEMKRAGTRRSSLLIAAALLVVMTLGWSASASSGENTAAAGRNSLKFKQEPASGRPPAANRQGGVKGGPGQDSTIAELTGNLVAENNRYQAAGRLDREQMLGELRGLAAARFERLAELIGRDPAEVLRVAVPASVRAAMPVEVQDLVERRVELLGEIVVLYECAERESRLLHFLEADGVRFLLHFAGDPPGGLLTGARVTIKGVRVGQAVALESDMDGLKVSGERRAGESTSESANMTNLATVAPNTFGEQKILVILVNFQDKQTQPFTVSEASNVVFGTVNDYIQEASFQQTWLSGDVYGWYTIPINSTCEPTIIALYAKQAATAAGVNLSAYQRYIFAFPSISCSFLGVGTIGGNPSQTLINGNMELRTVGHELEHNLGLYHSRALECGVEVTGDNCSSVEYGDIVDIMGRPGVTGHSHAFQKERLGWLDYGVSPSILTVQGSGAYELSPFESPGSSPKALKILKSVDSVGRKLWYYVEFRRPIGFDSFISGNSSVMNGVLIHQANELDPSENYLLDMTPRTSSWDDAALAVGRSYTDSANRITISTVSVSNERAIVKVAFGHGNKPCAQADPTITPSPSQTQWSQAGTTVAYSVSVTNNNSGGCANSDFNLQSTLPAGWAAAFGNSILNIAPGGSAITNVQITSPAGVSDGFYNIELRAENSLASTFSALAFVTNVIASSIQISASASQSSYASNQRVSVLATVIIGGLPSPGVNVTFTIARPNGTVITGNAVTGEDGSALFSYRLDRKQDLVGVYQVTASANLNGLFGDGKTSFMVQ
jgi:hypothetical protein